VINKTEKTLHLSSKEKMKSQTMAHYINN